MRCNFCCILGKEVSENGPSVDEVECIEPDYQVLDASEAAASCTAWEDEEMPPDGVQPPAQDSLEPPTVSDLVEQPAAPSRQLFTVARADEVGSSYK